MTALRHLNIDKAIESFLKSVDRVSHLPFVTDSEMTLLYGEEVTESLRELARKNESEEICHRCAKKCCPLVNCELYDPGLSQCPIYDYRPALCRMHFCDQFPVGDISFIREFADIFLDSLIEAKRRGSQKIALLDCPPFTGQAAEFVKNVSPWIAGFKEGKIDEVTVLSLIHTEIKKYSEDALGK